ncbi:MAG: PEP-CTERM sorting domain-containing protein [Verrucomicrobia bacterium]|nr:PEP-CTERM sorting domain-containing protein [Verrucomicrobiota bacterium]
MTVLEKLMGAATATLLVLAIIPTSANATPVVTTTFTFTGLCDDCAGNSALFPGNQENIGDGLFQPVSGTLVLKILSPGQIPASVNGGVIPINLTNFFSFTYDGSALLDAFTVFGPPIMAGIEGTVAPEGLSGPLFATFLTGTLDAAGNVLSNFILDFGGNLNTRTSDSLTGPIGIDCGGPEQSSCSFFVGTNGFWSIGFPVLDFGISGTFADIPEPGTLALFGLGLLGLGLARRRKAA